MRLPAVVSWLLTFGSVVLLWVVFRSGSLSESGKMIAAMLDVKSIALPLPYARQFGFLGKLGEASPLMQYGKQQITTQNRLEMGKTENDLNTFNVNSKNLDQSKVRDKLNHYQLAIV